jgi:riboflavin synthase
LFTGIVTEVGTVLSILPDKLTVGANQILKNAELGGSIAVNGACLTATNFTANSFTVDLSPETVRRTNLGMLKNGDPVNLERAMTLGGELGGHLVQGHIDGTGRILEIHPEGGSVILRFAAAPEIMRFLVEKGFIAVEGISLTVTSRDAVSFQVAVINFTWQHTNLQTHKLGDLINLEVDILAKYVVQFLQAQRTSNITEGFLKANGF